MGANEELLEPLDKDMFTVPREGDTGVRIPLLSPLQGRHPYPDGGG